MVGLALLSLAWQSVAPGVSYRAYELEGPMRVFAMRIELDTPGVGFEAVPGRDELASRERPSSVFARARAAGSPVVAAINGDFGGPRNVPRGMLVREGRLVTSGYLRSSFLIDGQGRPDIRRLEVRFELAPNPARLWATTLFNRWYPFEHGDRRLFDHHMVRTEETEEPVIETFFRIDRPGWRLDGPPLTLTTLRSDVNRGGSPIGPDEIVLQSSASRRYASFFEPGEQTRLHMRVLANGEFFAGPSIADPNTHVGPRIETAISGGPRVLRDGEVSIESEIEGIRNSFVTDRHPRTGIGFSNDRRTVYAVVIDGRREGWSIGATLYDVADVLRDLGASDGMNLDGGGSSTMVIDGEVVNRPSDPTGEREVTSTLLIRSEL